MSDRTILALLLAGGLALGVGLSRLLVRASWPAVGGACCLWILILAAVAFGSGNRAEAQGWALGFAAFLTMPGIIIGSVLLKIAGLR